MESPEKKKCSPLGCESRTETDLVFLMLVNRRITTLLTELLLHHCNTIKHNPLFGRAFICIFDLTPLTFNRLTMSTKLK